MFKFFYDKFWYPVLGRILSKFVIFIEGNKEKRTTNKPYKTQD